MRLAIRASRSLAVISGLFPHPIRASIVDVGTIKVMATLCGVRNCTRVRELAFT
jgi:hypothetical protein